MNWTAYGSFLVFAVILVLIPGADFAVVTRNALLGLQAVRSAIRGDYGTPEAGADHTRRGWRQGLLVFAFSHAVLSLMYLCVLVRLGRFACRV